MNKQRISVEEEKDEINIKGSLSGLRQFLATEAPLKIMKNVFYFVLKIFKLFS